jgi:ADP-heptose:LPS heptosyltransferase
VSDRAAIAEGPRTLIVELMGLGDLVMTTPALWALRRALPGTHLGVLCRSGVGEILGNNPRIDQILPFAVTRSRPLQRLRVRRLVQTIRANGYQQALVLDRYRRMDLWLQEAGIPRERCFLRISAEGDFETPRADEKRSLRSPNVDSRDSPIHISDQYLAFVEKLLARPVERGLPEVFVADSDREEARRLLERRGIGPDQPFWVAHPGLSSFSKGLLRRRRKKIAHRAWPLRSWRILLERLVDEQGTRVVLTGSPGDAALHRELRSRQRRAIRSRIFDLAGATRPLVLAALLERARGYVGVDTGPMHVAAALGRPVVALFGPTNPLICGPRGPDPQPLVVSEPLHCSPCTRPVRKGCRDNLCMKAIEPPRVLEAIEAVGGTAKRDASTPP